MKPMRIAVIMTCFNRKVQTVECLRRIKRQTGLKNITIDIFLVDDGSTDGTGDSVRQSYPDVRVLEGDGSLFWCGGMRLGFGEALKSEYDFYLWMNDDTTLYPNAIKIILETHGGLSTKLGTDAIVVGSLCDIDTGKLTYGGSRILSRWCPTQYQMLQPQQDPRRCDVFHGNCVLIPQKIARTVGNMSADYKHGPGDKDYALRTSQKGFTSWITPGYVGNCSKNSLLEQWKNKELSTKERIEALNHPVIRARVEDWVVFTKTYHKFLWPSFCIRAAIRLRWPRLYIYYKTAFSSRAKAESG